MQRFLRIPNTKAQHAIIKPNTEMLAIKTPPLGGIYDHLRHRTGF